MNLPPRIKTQHPNGQNIVYDVDTPIPIESAFFLEDAKQDPNKPNRYYFNFPGNWITSNNGETIIGIREIKMLKVQRKLKFNLRIAKILKTEREKKENKNLTDGNEILKNCKGVKYFSLKMIIWYQSNQDIDDIFNMIHQTFTEKLAELEEETIFEQSDYNPHNRDIQIDGVYGSNEYYIKIFSERNDNYEKPYDTYTEPYLVLFKFENMNDDFKEIFNIGTQPYQNDEKEYQNWKFDHIFHNVWDRKPCKLYSSIAEQSNHGYIGSSEVQYSPIKYYKLKSTDQQFWIEFYLTMNQNIPVRLPKGESFCMEMQFLPYDKMLQI